MLPSSKYAEDTGARQTLANGTVLKWTSQVGSMYSLNDPTDLSICYTNWNDPNILTKATKTLNSYFPSCDLSEPDMGFNDSTSNDKASGWTRKKTNSPRVEDIYAGVVIANNKGYHYWGYSPLASSKKTDDSGNTARFLLDMDINKMLFKITITAVDKTTMPTTADYDGNWTSKSVTTTTITLKQLYENPDRYLVTSYSWGGALIYGENTSDHWRSVSGIYPSFILNNGDSVGGFIGKSIFGSYNGTTNLSFVPSTGHVTSGGGSTALNVYSHLDEQYAMGHPFEFTIKPDPASYQTLGSQAQQAYTAKYGTAVATHTMYICCNLIDVGDAIAYWGQTSLECQYYTSPEPNLVYRKLHWSWNRYIKGDKFLAYLAAFGLYFLNDNSYDPDSDNITPDTLGDTDKIWLGEMLGGGVTTGRWITDLNSYHGPNKEGKTSNPDYNPTPSPSPTDPWDVDPETYGWGGGEVSGMVKYYLLTSGQMGSLQSAIASNANWTIDYLNCVVSCFVVPNSGIFFDAPIPTTVKFKLDNATEWDTGVACARIQGTKNKSGGTIEIPRLTHTFYDFEPYSDYSIYIPFCGRIPIKGNLCLGREIKVTYYPDVPTCSLTAVVSCGGATIAIAKGSFGTMTPITSNGSDRKTAAVIGDVAPIITGIGTGIVGVALGNPLIVGAGATQALGGIMGGVKETVQSYAYSVGSTGDSSFFGAGNRCYYYANYPLIDEVVNNSMFGHSVGYLCNTVGKLSSFTGFTICANPHVTFSATSEEREEIERLLSMGVIL